MKATYAWRRSADPHPVLYLDVVIESAHGWRMVSFAAYDLMAQMSKELNR